MNRENAAKGNPSVQSRKINEQKAELEEAFNDCSMKIQSMFYIFFN